MPFVRNQWYAAIWSGELSDAPVARRILGQTIVLFRCADAKVAALDDICPHRFVPLHLGKVVNGGRLRCGYHGLEFDGTGACVHNPHTNGRIPPAAKVRSYSAVERHGMVWVWLGDRPADPDLVPDFSHLDRADPKLLSARQWIEVKANYTIVVDNLLDLSHVCVLHEGLLGNAEMADAELSIEETHDGFIVKRLMCDVPPPELVGLLYGNHEDRVDSWADIRLIGTSSLINNVGASEPGKGREGGRGMLGAHILTPIDEETTLYHFCSMRVNPPARSDDEELTVSRHLSQLARQVFTEQDAPVMEAQQANFANPSIDTSRPAMFDIDIGAARYARHLNALLAADSEH